MNKATQWRKGQSGNPNGRPPRAWTWMGLLEEVAEEIKSGSTEPRKVLIARKLFAEAEKGNVQAIKELMNRMDGMPAQPLEHDGEVDFKGVIVYKPEKNRE